MFSYQDRGGSPRHKTRRKHFGKADRKHGQQHEEVLLRGEVIEWIRQADTDAAAAFVIRRTLLADERPLLSFEGSAAVRATLITRLRNSTYSQLGAILIGMTAVYDVWPSFVSPEELLCIEIHLPQGGVSTIFALHSST